VASLYAYPLYGLSTPALVNLEVFRNSKFTEVGVLGAKIISKKNYKESSYANFDKKLKSTLH